MVMPNDIMTEIKRKIAAAFPAYAIYIQACPKDFVRPSLLLEYIKSSQKDANRSTVERTVDFKITCFTPVDALLQPNIAELSQLQEDTIRLFSNGCITVVDRSIKVQVNTFGIELDRAFINVQFNFFDNRTDALDTTPKISSVKINLQEG